MQKNSDIADLPTPETPVADSEERRSYAIEVIGIFSAFAFFVGVFFAYQTFAAGLVTQREFNRLETGLTVAEADTRLGFIGQKVESSTEEEQPEIYRWENSTLSYVECEFVDGRLVTKKAVELPH